MRPKPFGFSFIYFFCAVVCASALAADVTWTGGTNGTGTAWLTGSNWFGGSVPGAFDNAIFGSAGNANTIGINMNGSTNNGPNNQAVGAIILDASNSADRLIKNSSLSVDGTLTLNGNGGTLLANHSAFLLTVTSGPDRNLAVVLGSSGNITADGPIVINSSMSGPGVAISFPGSGTVTLNGANTYSGGTTISAGTVLVNTPESLGSGVGSGTVLVTGSGTLGGTGNVRVAANQKVLIQSGGTISPGNGDPATLRIAGTQTVASGGGTSTLDLTSGATFRMDISATGAADKLALAGTIDITNANLTVQIAGGFQAAAGSTFLLVDNDSNDPVTGTFAQGGTVTANDGEQFSINYSGGDGNDIVLTALGTAVPEPATWQVLMAGAYLLTLTAARCRRSKTGSQN